jgi:hypothetical protein
MPPKNATAFGKNVDVWRMNVVNAVAIEFRPQIINADQQNILSFCLNSSRQNSQESQTS